MSRVSENSGAATLPTIILMSAIIVEITVAGVVIASALNNSIYSQRVAAQALSAAKAGTDDAFMRVVRYKSCPSGSGGGCPSTYCLNGVGDYPTCTAGGTISGPTAAVTMSNDGNGVITVNSTGTVSGRKKKLQMIIGVDSNTGLVGIQSIQEVAY